MTPASFLAMDRLRLTVMALLAVATTLHAQPAAPGRARFNFNPGWLVMVGDTPGAEAAAFADTDWKKVTLPYAWNEDSAFKVNRVPVTDR